MYLAVKKLHHTAVNSRKIYCSASASSHAAASSSSSTIIYSAAEADPAVTDSIIEGAAAAGIDITSILADAIDIRTAEERLGDEYRQLGYFEAAHDQYMAASTKSPRSPRLYYSMAKCSARLLRPGRAILELSRVVELQPDNIRAQLDMARAYLRFGDPNHARKHASAALEMAENDLKRLYDAGAGDEELMEMFTTAHTAEKIAAVVTEYDSILREAKAARKAGDIGAALSWFSQIKARCPSVGDNISVVRAHAQCLQQAGQWAQLTDLCRSYLPPRLGGISRLPHSTLVSHHADICGMMAAGHWNLGSDDEALAACSAALSIDGRHVEATALQTEIIYTAAAIANGDVLMEERRFRESQNAFNQVLKSCPVVKLPMLRTKIAQCMAALHNYGAAEKELQSALSMQPGLNEARFLLSDVLCKLGRYSEALNEARKIAPDPACSAEESEALLEHVRRQKDAVRRRYKEALASRRERAAWEVDHAERQEQLAAKLRRGEFGGGGAAAAAFLPPDELTRTMYAYQRFIVNNPDEEWGDEDMGRPHDVPRHASAPRPPRSNATHKSNTIPESSGSPPPDFYGILGLHGNTAADEKAVQRAFRDAVRAHHPDKGGSDVLFEAVHVAREVLMNAEARRRYDALLLSFESRYPSFDWPSLVAPTIDDEEVKRWMDVAKGLLPVVATAGGASTPSSQDA